MKPVIPWFKRVVVVVLALGLMGACSPKKESSGSGSGSGSATPPTEHGVEVVLADNADPVPLEVQLSRSGPANHVRWSNATAVPRVVHFKAGWPFMEPQEDVQIAANSKSSWYTLTTTAPTSSPYEVTPELKPGGPPDEPAITAGP